MSERSAAAHPFERVLVVGARGQLGSELMRALAGFGPFGPERSALDLTDVAAVRKTVDDYRPTLVINTAAFHKVDACEADPATAFAVNALGVDRLAAVCARSGATFAHVSTDYVFSGSKRTPYDETDAALPLNAYGASKLAGEHLIRRHGEAHFIFRTSGLFGPGGASTKGPTFVERMLQFAERGESPRVVDDIVFSPSYAPHVALAMCAVMATEQFGLYHVTNAGQCSWWALAVETLRAAGYETAVERIVSGRDSGTARRPVFSALGHGELMRRGFAELPPWQEGVRAFVAARGVRQDAASSAST